MKKVFVNGYGSIGSRIVSFLKDDPEITVVGIGKYSPDDKVTEALTSAYKQLSIGNPLDQNNHVGPLIDQDAVNNYLHAIEAAQKEGGKVLVEGGVLDGEEAHQRLHHQWIYPPSNKVLEKCGMHTIQRNLDVQRQTITRGQTEGAVWCPGSGGGSRGCAWTTFDAIQSCD